MKKIPFKLIDIIIILTIFVFFIVILESQRADVSIFVSLWTILLLISFVSNVLNRIKLIRYENLLQNIEQKHESELSDEDFKEYLDIKGKKLELAIEIMLKKLYKNIVIFKDVNIPTNNKRKTQIDVIAIINNKIIVFEAKAYSTTLQGDWSDLKLKTNYANIKFINNPVIQNKYHIDQLSQITMPNLEYFGSMIVFGEFTKYPFITPPYRTRISKLKDLKTNIDGISRYIEALDEDLTALIIKDLEKYSSKVIKS